MYLGRYVCTYVCIHGASLTPSDPSVFEEHIICIVIYSRKFESPKLLALYMNSELFLSLSIEGSI